MDSFKSNVTFAPSPCYICTGIDDMDIICVSCRTVEFVNELRRR